MYVYSIAKTHQLIDPKTQKPTKNPGLMGFGAKTLGFWEPCGRAKNLIFR
jgi:hypothetical protein